MEILTEKTPKSLGKIQSINSKLVEITKPGYLHFTAFFVKDGEVILKTLKLRFI